MMIVTTMPAGMAITKPPKNQNTTLNGRFTISGGGGKIVPNTSPIDNSYGIKAEKKNTRPNKKKTNTF